MKTLSDPYKVRLFTYGTLKKEGRLKAKASGEVTDGKLNFIPKMDPDLLVAGYHKIISTIYSTERYYMRMKHFMKFYKPTSSFVMEFQKHIGAFFRSVWKIGIFSSHRWHYWGFLLPIFFTKIKAFPLAVEMTISLVHFQKVYSKVNKGDKEAFDTKAIKINGNGTDIKSKKESSEGVAIT